VLMPDEPEALGVLALMLFHDSRREARTSPEGELVLLEDQDRSLWNQQRIQEGRRILERASRLRRIGPYQLQAAIAASHAEETRDWSTIAGLYEQLARIAPSPIVDLNRAVAMAMASRLDEGLDLISQIEGLDDYHLLHAARADLLRRLGRSDEAAGAYRQALALTPNQVERAFLQRRLSEVG
jgi:RNA polymerase sigma-70 factor, ECF subfamily